MVSKNHVSSSLRLLDQEGGGIRTFSHVREGLTRDNVVSLIVGVNGLLANQAHGALHTVRAELYEA